MVLSAGKCQGLGSAGNRGSRFVRLGAQGRDLGLPKVEQDKKGSSKACCIKIGHRNSTEFEGGCISTSPEPMLDPDTGKKGRGKHKYL